LNQNQPIEIDVQDIDHLGVIAGIVDEIAIVEIINRLLGTHPLEKISAGHVVKAMILNCLGFLTAPLYLFNQFFVGKATEHLIGQGVKPEHINDSRIGRVLDQLYQKGLTSVFVEIALAAVKRFGVSMKQVHLDGSSICVQGEYLSDQAKTNSVKIASLNLDKRIAKAKSKQAKALKELIAHPFACETDALDAAKTFGKELKYHRFTEIEVQLKPQYERPGRPRQGESPKRYTYHLQGTLVLNEEAVTLLPNQAGRFILATNLLDDRLWSNQTVLQEYKNQHSCERGFRFLKDPIFFASRMFVKSPQRVASLAMIMGLCLLVYSIAQRQLRSSLASFEETVPNQRGQPTERPTLRWVLQCWPLRPFGLGGCSKVVD
jgi:transposase